MNKLTPYLVSLLAVIGMGWSVSLGSFSPVCVQIEASDGEGSDQVEIQIPVESLSASNYSWQLESPITLSYEEHTLGTVESLGVSLQGDPGVNLVFAVTAGSSLTTFSINSATVSFGAISNPLGYATAGITLTDANQDGATLTGQYPGSKAYQARYNTAATVWANLISPANASSAQTVLIGERKPTTGWEVISASVDSIESGFTFSLTPQDTASGTSRFEVVIPEPATFSLLVIGGLALLRRRRK
jgi:hypothetical protein